MSEEQIAAEAADKLAETFETYVDKQVLIEHFKAAIEKATEFERNRADKWMRVAEREQKQSRAAPASEPWTVQRVAETFNLSDPRIFQQIRDALNAHNASIGTDVCYCCREGGCQEGCRCFSRDAHNASMGIAENYEITGVLMKKAAALRITESLDNNLPTDKKGGK